MFREQAAIVKTLVEKPALPCSAEVRVVRGGVAFPTCWWLACYFFTIPWLQ